MFRILFSKTGLMIAAYLVLGFLAIGGPVQPHDMNGLAELAIYVVKLMVWPIIYFTHGSISIKV